MMGKTGFYYETAEKQVHSLQSYKNHLGLIIMLVYVSSVVFGRNT